MARSRGVLHAPHRRPRSRGGRWEYCETVLKRLGIAPDRTDPQMDDLMDALGGHPLAMRAILPQLREHSAGARGAAATLRRSTFPRAMWRASWRRRCGSWRMCCRPSMPAAGPTFLHEEFVDLEYLEVMAKRAEPGVTRAAIDRFAGAVVAGLLRDRGQAIFELHPGADRVPGGAMACAHAECSSARRVGAGVRGGDGVIGRNELAPSGSRAAIHVPCARCVTSIVLWTRPNG